MADPVSKSTQYKGYELIATAMPLGIGGFNASVLVCREHGDYRTETKVVGKPNVKAWIHDTPEKALEHGFAIGRQWVDEKG